MMTFKGMYGLSPAFRWKNEMAYKAVQSRLLQYIRRFQHLDHKSAPIAKHVILCANSRKQTIHNANFGIVGGHK